MFVYSELCIRKKYTLYILHLLHSCVGRYRKKWVRRVCILLHMGFRYRRIEWGPLTCEILFGQFRQRTRATKTYFITT